MTRFDNELKDLDEVIKGKKAAAGKADLQLKDLDHAVVNLNKEKVAATNYVSGLEKQFEWIVEEHE